MCLADVLPAVRVSAPFGYGALASAAAFVAVGVLEDRVLGTSQRPGALMTAVVECTTAALTYSAGPAFGCLVRAACRGRAAGLEQLLVQSNVVVDHPADRKPTFNGLAASATME